MARYAGKRGLVYVSTSASGAAAPIGQMQNWTFDLTTDKLDVTCFGDGNKTYVQSWGAAKGTFKGLWNDADTTLFAAAASADGCKIYLYPSADAMGKYLAGPAWLDVSIEADVNGTVSTNGNFSANGTWTNTLTS